MRSGPGPALSQSTVDFAAGIPDSGVGHGIGYAAEARIPFKRPFVKYTPTWARSFMPQNQDVRDLVARMKLIPIRELIDGKRFLFCEDSIVRGTQLQDTIQRLFVGRGEGDPHAARLPAARLRLQVPELLGLPLRDGPGGAPGHPRARGRDAGGPLRLQPRPARREYEAMEERIRERLKLTTLKYQRIEDLVAAIGLPKSSLCTYCWDGVETG